MERKVEPDSDPAQLFFSSSARLPSSLVITRISRPPLLPTKKMRKPYQAIQVKIITVQIPIKIARRHATEICAGFTSLP